LEDLIGSPEPRSFPAFLQGCELLPKGEILGGQLGAIAEGGLDE
jgi:hypothetical protein